MYIQKNLWEISIKINFSETTPTTHTALQGNNVAKSEYILNGKIQQNTHCHHIQEGG